MLNGYPFADSMPDLVGFESVRASTTTTTTI